MNEEEKKAIEVGKEIAEKFKRLYLKAFNNEKITDKNRLSYLECALLSDFIEKLQKENEELKTELERQKDINIIINQKGLEKNYEKTLEKTMTKFLKNNIDKDVISIQKVKDKQKEKEWALESYYCTEADYKQSQAIGAWQVLQELIEEREENR